MTERLRIGLLQCGYLHPDLAPELGDYPELFATLLAPFDVELTTYDVQREPLPADPAARDGWLVSGSADSAYEPLPWIEPTAAFLRAVVADGAPLVAICFGHQLLAQALGGRVVRADQGWGVGVHHYALTDAAPWPDQPSSGAVRLIASHQDQVVILPEGATVVAHTEHCPNAAFTMGPRVLAIQPHPEFTAEISRRLIGLRRERIGAATSAEAEAGLDEPLDQALIAGWMYRVWADAAAQR